MGGITSVSEVWTSLEYLINELMNALRVQDTCRPCDRSLSLFGNSQLVMVNYTPFPLFFAIRQRV
jgi:hypothetical protein